MLRTRCSSACGAQDRLFGYYMPSSLAHWVSRSSAQTFGPVATRMALRYCAAAGCWFGVASSPQSGRLEHAVVKWHQETNQQVGPRTCQRLASCKGAARKTHAFAKINEETVEISLAGLRVLGCVAHLNVRWSARFFEPLSTQSVLLRKPPRTRVASFATASFGRALAPSLSRGTCCSCQNADRHPRGERQELASACPQSSGAFLRWSP